MEQERHIEQFEVIERHVTEGRRPITAREAANYIPTCEVKTSGETFVTSGQEANDVFRNHLERRAQIAGERDVSRNTSFVQDQILSPNINSYGFDEHVVNTNDGTARVIQTHGSGIWDGSPPRHINSSAIMHDRSLDTTLQQPGELNGSGHRIEERSASVLNAPTSILKNSDSRHFSSFENNSLARKDSYKRMQETQPFGDNVSYSPSSNATIISHKSPERKKWSFAQKAQNRGGFLLFLRSWFNEVVNDVRSQRMTPSLICGLLLLLLFFLFLIILLVIFLHAAFSPYSTHTFLLYPPRCEECLKRNPTMSAHRPPSKVYVHTRSPSEIDFELVGNRPFKSNSYTAIDFDSGYVAYADHALTNEHGKHTTCFLMELDRTALPSHSETLDAISNTDHEVQTEFGWQEYWQYTVTPTDANQAMSKFHSDVHDCQGAQWYLMKHTVQPRDSSCYDCYDFCLPDFAIQRTHKFYVPEWSRFTVQTDQEGGHWNYPHRQSNTQRNYDGEWVNWSPVSVVGQPNLHRRRK